MRRTIAAVSVVAALVVAPALYSGDEKPATGDVVKAKGQKSRGDAKDENIKSKSEKNDPNAKATAPPSKGGDKTRGGTCQVHWDNQTQWKIQVFTDGAYQGLLGPYADAYEWYEGTSGTLYGRADFDDGSVLTWGPQRAVCRGGAFHFQLQ